MKKRPPVRIDRRKQVAQSFRGAVEMALYLPDKIVAVPLKLSITDPADHSQAAEGSWKAPAHLMKCFVRKNNIRRNMLGVRHLFSQRAQTGEKLLIECSWFVFAVPECL